MQVEEFPLTKVNIDNIQLDPTNPNKPTKEQIAAIKKSFERFGFLVPVILNENMQVGDGEHRILIYKQLGITEIPAYIVPKLNNDIERRLLRQTMNKLRGEHDIKLDADEIALIFQDNKLDNLAELIAQQRESLENILTKHKGIEFQHEDNFDVDKALEDLVPTTQLGDIWQLGQHRLICADCSDERSIKRLMEDKKADLVLTDPPYNISDKMAPHLYATITGNKLNDLEEAEWDKNIDLRPALDMILPTLAENCTVYIFTSQYLAGDIWKWMSEWAKYWNYLVYCKMNPMPSLMKRYWTWATELICFATRGKQTFNFIEDTHNYNYLIHSRNESEGTKMTEHLTQKPIRLLTDIIKHSSNEDNIILDPFLGSGSTMIACEQTNRICYSVEIDPHYVDVCVKRWESYTGQKGQLISNTEKAAQ